MLFRKRILPCFLVLALFITMFGTIGTDEAYAASMKKAAKKIKVQVTSVSQNSATLRWNKIKKPYKGYAVFRNGEAIAYLGKKATSYTDTGIVAGTAYNYQIKTYKVKKVKKKKKYSYKKKSNVVSITTPAAPTKPTPARLEQVDKYTWKLYLPTYGDNKYHYGVALYVDAWTDRSNFEPTDMRTGVFSLLVDGVNKTDMYKEMKHYEVRLLDCDPDGDGIVDLQIKEWTHFDLPEDCIYVNISLN